MITTAIFDTIESTTKEDDEGVTVYRLKTSTWYDERGAYLRKELRIMKRMSGGGGHYYPFKEDMDNCGAEDVLAKITNLYDCEDGLYTLITTNHSHDRETGYVDDWDYVLVPHKP